MFWKLDSIRLIPSCKDLTYFISGISLELYLNAIIGIWSQLDTNCEYPFTKMEQDSIKNIKRMLKEGINKYTVYKYGLYISSVVGSIMGISYQKINNIYKKLPIYARKEINVNGMQIANMLHKEPGNYITDIINDIEYKIVNMGMENEFSILADYIIDKYGE